MASTSHDSPRAHSPTPGRVSMSGPGQVTRWLVTDMRARVLTMAARWFSVAVDCEEPHRLADATWVVLADPEANAFCVLAPRSDDTW